MVDPNIRYERVPYVVGDRIAAQTAVNGTFSDTDLRNDSGYVFVIEEVGFHADGQEAASGVVAASRPSAWSVRITDLARNIPWMKDFILVATLIDESGTTSIGNKWKLRYPTILPPNSGLHVEINNEVSTTAITVQISFIGYLLVPLVGDLFKDAAKMYEQQVRDPVAVAG